MKFFNRWVILSLLLSGLLFSSSPCSAQTAKDILKKLFEQATNAYYQKDYPNAIELYRKSLEIYPKFAPSLYYMGLCYREGSNDILEAKKWFQKAIEADPRHAQAYDQLSKIFYNQADFENAEQYALKALELNPELVGPRLSLGWIYLLIKNQPSDAIAYFEQAIKQTDIPLVQIGLGIAYITDNQKYKVLEMITNLRKAGREELALELERMVREPNFKLPEIGKALALKQQYEVKEKFPDANSLLEKSSKYDDAGSMQVILQPQEAPKPSSDTFQAGQEIPIPPDFLNGSSSGKVNNPITNQKWKELPNY